MELLEGKRKNQEEVEMEHQEKLLDEKIIEVENTAQNGLKNLKNYVCEHNKVL